MRNTFTSMIHKIFGKFACFVVSQIFRLSQKLISIRGTLHAPKMHVEEGDIRGGNSKQKAEIPASGWPRGTCATNYNPL